MHTTNNDGPGIGILAAGKGLLRSPALLILLLMGAIFLAFPSIAEAAPKPSVTISQCQPGPTGNPGRDCVKSGTDGWKPGLNHGPYARGETIPYRALFSNMIPGTYTLAVEYDTTKSLEHAIDYITDYDRTMTLANVCAGHLVDGGCVIDSSMDVTLDDQVEAGLDGDLTILGDNIVQVTGGFDLIGGTIDTVTYGATNVTGDGSNGNSFIFVADSMREVIVTFTVNTTGNVVLAWGGHIAMNPDWLDMANPSGSPYHMRTTLFSCNNPADSRCSAGSQDLALTEAAIVATASLQLQKPGSTPSSVTTSPRPPRASATTPASIPPPVHPPSPTPVRQWR